MKTSHFEGSIADWATKVAHGRDERTHSERKAFDNNFGGQWLVHAAVAGKEDKNKKTKSKSNEPSTAEPAS